MYARIVRMREVKNRAQIMANNGRGSEKAPLNTAADSALPSHAIDERNGMSRGSADLDFLPTVSGNISPLPFTFELEKRVSHTEPKARWYHAAFHTVTAMVGAGVLALPYSFSYLTWGGGLVCLAACTILSLYCSHLLADFHELPDGTRLNRYRDLGRSVLGPTLGTWTIVPIQFAVCVGLDTAYTLTAGQSLQAVQNPACNSHTLATTAEHNDQGCATALSWWIAGFAVLQILLSQLRDFHSLWWVSLIGALMSVCYSTIAFGASVAAVGKTGAVSHAMRPGSTADRLFGVMNAIGTVMFAFGGQAVQLEIQATLARPPSPYREMMKGIYVAYGLIVAAYFGVSIAGFKAFGNTINPDVLLSISNPQWLIKVANLMVVVHVAASFQLFAHPVFEAVEGSITRRTSRGREGKEAPLATRLVVRVLYCGICGAAALLLPFFNDVIGMVGSAGFVPLSFIFPSLFFVMKRKYTNRVSLWGNIAIIVVMSLAGILAFTGSFRNIILRAQNYHRS